MTKYLLKLEKSEAPAYLRVADTIRDAIQRRVIKSGEYLPSTRELASNWNLHRHTVMRGLQQLVSEGFIISSEKTKYRVTEQQHKFEIQFSGIDSLKPTSLPEFSLESFLPTEPGTDIKWSFDAGSPDPNTFPFDEFRQCFNSVLKFQAYKRVAHPDYYSNVLSDQVLSYLRQHRRVLDKNILLTYGSQNALYIAIKSLCSPKDTIAIETPGYVKAWAIFKSCNLKLAKIPVDRFGLDSNALENYLRTSKISLLYLTPLHQYPTMVTLSLERRQHIYSLARKYNFFILEDDYDHEYHYSNKPIAPLASNDPDGRIIYISTFSKVTFATFRLGYIAASREIIKRLKKYRFIINGTSDSVLSGAMGIWMKEGGFERHLRRMWQLFRKRNDKMQSVLSENSFTSKNWHWEQPQGGLAFWIKTDSNTFELYQNAMKQGIYFLPEDFCHEEYADRNYLRLGFAGLSEGRIVRGIKKLAIVAKNHS